VSTKLVSGSSGLDTQGCWQTRRCLLSLFFLLLVAFLVPKGAFAQKFKNPTLIPTGSDPSTISEADINGDGKPDLLYLDGSAPKQLHVLLGNGDGTFTAGQNVQLPSQIGGTIALADVNKDSKLDVVLGGDGPTGEVAVLLGNGDGTFQTAIVSSFTPSVSAYVEMLSLIGVADFNGDGAVDLAAADILNNNIYILTGNNKGSFTLKTTIFAGGYPSKVVTADLNGDGHQDFLVQEALGSSVTVYLGNGDGTFQPGVNYSGPDHVSGFILADFDGDSRPDLAVTGFDFSVAILHGNSDGTFDTTSEGGTSYAGPGAVALAAADFNSDGTLDIACASSNGIGIQFGTSGLSFSAPKFYSGSPTPTPAVVADFDADGHLDFAEIAPGGIALLFGAANGTLESADVYDLGPNQSTSAVAIADFNGDKIPDIVTADDQPAPVVLLGKGSGQFSVPADLGTPTSVGGQLFPGDFNGDGKMDLLATAAGSPASYFVYRGNGNGTFTAASPLNSSALLTYGNVTVADFNHDGKSDIASLDYESLDVFLGQSSGSFIEGSYGDFWIGSQGIASGDFNQDGKLDVVVSQDQANPLQVFLGNGDGTFKAADQLPAVNLPNVVAAADIDGDGHIDLIVCLGYYNLVQIMYGNGDGSFQPPVNITTLRQYMQMSVADMNGDGLPDLILTDGAVIAIIPNVGGRAFGAEHHFLAGPIASFAVQDLNGDSLPDIVVANGSVGSIAASTVTVLLNQGAALLLSGTLTLNPASPIGLKKPFAINLQLATGKSGAPTPTGTVELAIDDSPVTSLKVQDLSLTYTDSNSLPIGSHTLVATYSGDSNYLSGTFTLPFQIIANTYPTTTALAASSSSAVTGQTIRFTATVTSVNGTIDTPNGISGTVAFRDGSTNIGAVSLDANSVAVFDTSLLASATHSITASFLGMTAIAQEPGSFAPSTSSAIAVTIGSTSTTTSISAMPSAPQAGAVVSLTAVVKAASGKPTGAVEFFSGTSPLAVQPLDAAGTAVTGVTFASVGTETVTAIYQANGAFASSTSSALSITVSAASNSSQSSTSLTSAPNAQSSNGLYLTATVTAKSSVPTGDVIFMDGASQVGKTNVNTNGVATVNIQLADSGVHYLHAVYSGDSKLAPSVSSVLSEETPFGVPSFSLSVSGSSITIGPGQSWAVAVTINAANGFKSPVFLSCSTNSPDVTCALATSSFASGAGTSSATISSFRRQASALEIHEIPRGNGQSTRIGVLCVLVSMILISMRRRRLATAFALIVLIFVEAACSGSHSSSSTIDATSGTYKITITASASSGASPASRSVPIVVNVVQP
jgi:Bacterial Ig-like domain (group 3)/FG-GAP-like repeat